MYQIYLDKNELFEANIELEGASLDETFARLVMNTDKWNLVFEGDIDRKGNVTIPISKLKNIFTDDVKGDLRLEVVADDTYFAPWHDEFELLMSKRVTVEVKDNKKEKVIKESTPKVTVKQKGKTEKPKKQVESKKIDNELAKIYISEIIKANLQSKGNSISKKSIQETTDNFIKENDLAPSAKRTLYGLVKEKREVIENALREIRF